jgi:hypothetical protein
MNNIIIIGTQPPCPRCKLLTTVVAGKVKEYHLDAKVNHLSYADIEAVEIARSFGLEPGTAKEVANKANQNLDQEKINEIIQDTSLSKNTEFKEINDCNWSMELDEFLKPYQQMASELGILMTPVLIINGELKHNGSVPKLAQIEEWLMELKN